jgi:V8-like Glu-specific endopeptidase
MVSTEKELKGFFLSCFLMVFIFSPKSYSKSQSQTQILPKSNSLSKINTFSRGNLYPDIQIVYGEDNREDVDYSQPLDAVTLKVAHGTAAMIRTDKLRPSATASDKFTIKTEGSYQKICDTERFYEQPQISTCSGFLVAPDILVTAGHCMNSPLSCSSNSWVFDFTVNSLSSEGTQILKKNVYGCKEVLAQEFDNFTKMDYAIVRLDRNVIERKPLQIRHSGSVDVANELMVVGYPTGLPLKYAKGAYIRPELSENLIYFNMNSDSFQGNSGSPVVDVLSGMVEGILVRGDKDYNYDAQNFCYVVNQCENNSCRGEDATRLIHISKKLKTLYPTNSVEGEE